MALQYFLYNTDFGNTIVDRSNSSFSPVLPYEEIYIDFFIPETQPVYLYANSGGTGGTIIINTEENINNYLDSITPAPTANNNVTYGEFTGTTSILENYIGNGVITGFTISRNESDSGLTSINITSGIGYFVDNTNINNPVISKLEFSGQTGITIQYIASGLTTYIAVDNSGNIIQNQEPFTANQRREYILLGVVIHTNLTNINEINNLTDVALNINTQFNEFLDLYKNFNVEGNVFSPNGANLKLNKSEGKIFKRGSNFENDINNPNVLTLNSLTAPVNMRYRLSDSTEYGNTSNISLYYESPLGTRNPLPSTGYTIQRINIFPSNEIRIQYGQDVYDTLGLAISSIYSDPYVIEENINENGLLRGYLIIKGSVTSLLNEDEAYFIEAERFGNMPKNAGDIRIGLQRVTETQAHTNIETTFESGVVVDKIRPTTDSVSGVTINKNDGSTPVITIDTVSGLTGFGTIPSNMIHTFGTDDSEDDLNSTHKNGITIDGVVGGDKDLVWADNGVDKWFAEIYRNEDGRFWYLYSEEADLSPITVSESGRIGLNSTTNIIDYQPVKIKGLYAGISTNNVFFSGLYDKNFISIYQLEIDDAITIPNTFRWRKSVDDGNTYDVWSDSTGCTTGGTIIDSGVEVSFIDISGFTSGDTWQITAFPQLSPATLSLVGNKLNRVFITYNYTALTPTYFDLSTTVNTTSVEAGFAFPTGSTFTAAFAGGNTKINSMFVNVLQGSVGFTMTVEYWNGSEWIDISVGSDYFVDGTENLTKTGTLSWNISTMTDWTPLDLNNSGDEYYWLRVRTSSAPTQSPILGGMARGGNNRFSVFSSAFDLNPSFNIDALGRTSVGGGDITGNNRLQINEYRNTDVVGFNPSLVEIDSNESDKIDLKLKLSSDDSNSGGIIFGKTRGTLIDSTNISSGDSIGHLYFAGLVNSTAQTISTIETFYTGDGSTNYGEIIFKTASGGAEPTEKIRVSDLGTGFGVIPTARVHIQSGTTSIPPLKFTSGDLLTSPEAGAVEYDGNTFYATISGDTRKTFAFLESPVFTGDVYLPAGTVYADGIRTNTIRPLNDGLDTLKIISATGNTTLVTFNSLSGFTGFGTVIPTDLIHTYIATGNSTIMNGSITMDGDIGFGKSIAWAENGVNKWYLGIDGDNKGEIIYLHSHSAMHNPLTITNDGKIGFNKQTNKLNPDAAPIINIGLDDITISGNYTENYNTVYEIEIASTGATDTFKWRKSIDAAITFDSWSSTTGLTTTPTEIEHGVNVQWNSVSGHSIGMRWRFGAFTITPQATVTVAPMALQEVVTTDDYSAGTIEYDDITSRANGGLYSSGFNIFSSGVTGTQQAFYWGVQTEIDSLYFNLDQTDNTSTLIVEYYNGSEWIVMNSTNNVLIDGTENLSKSGEIIWSHNTMPDWVKTNIPNTSSTEYSLYWMRIRTTTNPTIPIIGKSISIGNNRRLAVYTAHNDYNPSFYVDSLGRTNIGGGNITGSNRLQINENFNVSGGESAISSYVEINSNDSSAVDMKIKLASNDTDGGSYQIFKERGTLDVPLGIETDDNIGNILFRGRVDTVGRTLGTITSNYVGDGTSRYSDMIFSTASGAEPTEKIRISENGAGFGGVIPTAHVHIVSGSTTIPALKIDAGNLLTTPQAGAVEFDGQATYITTTGSTRETFAYLNDPVFTGDIVLPSGTTITNGVATNFIRPLNDGLDTLKIISATGNTTLVTFNSLSGFTGFGTVIPETLVHLYGTDTGNTNAYGVQTNGVRIDGLAGVDKEIQWASEGIVDWTATTYRNENGRFWYLANRQSENIPIVVSEDGRTGFNNQTNIMDKHATQLQGTLNDLVISGLYSESYTRIYQIEIDSTSGVTDTYHWRSSIDLGVNYGNWSSSNNLTTTPSELQYGVFLNFINLTGHTVGDKWEFGAFSQLPVGNFIVTPPKINEVFRTDNYLAGTIIYEDITGAANTTTNNLVTTIFKLGGVSNAIYFGDNNKINGIYINLIQPAQGATLVGEYWDGSDWTQISTVSNSFLDKTNNLENSGLISWEITSMSDWEKNTLPDVIESIDSLYWVRFRTTTSPAQESIAQNFTTSGNYRMAVLSAPNDYQPCFYIDSLGRTNIGGGNITDYNQLQINEKQNISLLTGGGDVTSIVEIDSEDSTAADLKIKLSSDDSFSGGITLLKTRGDLANPQDTLNGDSIGHINFVGGFDNCAVILANIQSQSTGSGGGDIVISNADNKIISETVRFTSSGTTGFGICFPEALVHLNSGTTSIAPLKFTNGDLLSTPQAGAMEYSDDVFYGTISGNERKTFAFLESPQFTGDINLPTTTCLDSVNLNTFILNSGGTNNSLLVNTTDYNIYTGNTDSRITGNDNDIIYLSGQTDTKLPTATFDAYTGGTIAWDKVNKSGSDLSDLENRNASDVNYSETHWNVNNVQDSLNEISEYVENFGITGRIAPIDVLFGTQTNTLSVSGGTGYINYDGYHRKISWSGQSFFISGGTAERIYYVYVDSNSDVNISASEPNYFENISLGTFYFGGYIGVIQQSGIISTSSSNRVVDSLLRQGIFIYDNGGNIQLLSGSTVKISSPPCKIQYGLIPSNLIEISSNDASTYKFLHYYNSADYQWALNYHFSVMNEGKIYTNRWNDITKNSYDVLSAYTTTFTQYSNIVTSTSDLTSLDLENSFIYLSGDTDVYATPVSGVTWDGSGTTITLETIYVGSGGTGTPVANYTLPKLATDRYAKHLIIRSNANQMFLVLGQTTYGTIDEARNGVLPAMPTGLVDYAIKMAYIVNVGEATTLVGNIFDIRPLPYSYREGGQSGGGTTITNHGDLTGLSNDDHLQYLRTDGTRNLTGIQKYQSQPTFTNDLAIVTKKYIDDNDNLKLNISTFSTYSGTTIPNTYYNKTQIDNVTGASSIRLTNVENDITYISGITDTKLDLTGGTITGDLKVEGDIYVTGTTPTIQDIENSYLLGAISSDGRIIKTNSSALSISQKVQDINASTGITNLYGIYYVNTTAGDITLTIPNSATINDGARFSIIKKAGNNDVIITTVGGTQNIGNQTSQSISQTDKGLTIVSDFGNTKWLVVQDSRFLQGSVEGELQYWDTDTGKWKVTGSNLLWSDTTNTLNIGGSICGNSLNITGNTTIGGTTTLVGIATAPTAAVDTSTTQIATTAFVLGQAGTANPLIDGSAAAGTSNRHSREDHRHPTDTSRLAVTTFAIYSGATASAINLKAPLASPALTGTPTAPTAVAGTNTTQIATTAYYISNAANSVPLMDGSVAVGTSTRFAREDHVHPNDTTKASLNGATFTGDLRAIKPIQNDNTTCVATTSWYISQAGTASPLMDGSAAVGTSFLYSRQDHVHASDTSRLAVSSFNTYSGNTATLIGTKAPIISPTFTTSANAPTPVADNNSTCIATTAWYFGQCGTATPLMDGIAAVGTSTKWAHDNHIHPTDTSRAPLASPALTGTPTAPTAAVNTNTTQIATTAYVVGQAANVNPLMDSTVSIGTSLRYARQDHRHASDTSRVAKAGDTMTGALVINSDLTVTGNTNISGDTNINGITYLGNVTPDVNQQNFSVIDATTKKVADSGTQFHVYGSEFHYSQNLAAATTTVVDPTYETLTTITTNVVPAGTYKITASWQFNNASTNRDMLSRIQVDGTDLGSFTNFELGDSASYLQVSRTLFITFVTAASHTIDLQFSNENTATLTIYDQALEFIRVS